MTGLPGACPKPAKRETPRAKAFHREPTKKCPKDARAGFHECYHGMVKGGPVKAKRSKPRRAPLKCEALRAWIRQQPCFITGSRTNVVAAHLPRVRRHGDLNNLLPLNDYEHKRQHQVGIETFARENSRTLEGLADLARDYTERFFKEHPELALEYANEWEKQ